MSFIIFVIFEHIVVFYVINAIMSGSVIWRFAPVGNPAKGSLNPSM